MITAIFPCSHEHMKRLLLKYTVLKVKFIIGSSNILFAGWGSEGVKNENTSSARMILFFSIQTYL